MTEAETLVNTVDNNFHKRIIKPTRKSSIEAVLFEEGGYFKGLITQGDLLRYFTLNNHNIFEAPEKDLVVSDLKVTRSQGCYINCPRKANNTRL